VITYESPGWQEQIDYAKLAVCADFATGYFSCCALADCPVVTRLRRGLR